MKGLFMKRRPALYIESHPTESELCLRPWVRVLALIGQFAIGFIGWLAFAYVILSLPSPM